jgi:hypothetical protein
MAWFGARRRGLACGRLGCGFGVLRWAGEALRLAGMLHWVAFGCIGEVWRRRELKSCSNL